MYFQLTLRVLLLDELRLLVLDEPVVVAPVRVPDDVVQDHQPLKQQLGGHTNSVSKIGRQLFLENFGSYKLPIMI